MSDFETPQLPPLAPVVVQALRDAIDFGSALYDLHPGSCGSNVRDNLAAAYLAVSLEHRESVLLLVRQGAASSACALGRPVYETCVRGLWAKFSARDEQLENLHQRGIAPKFETAAKQLATSEIVGSLAEIRAEAWEPLSDFAHGGPRQLRSWMVSGEIAPQHDAETIASLLLVMDIYGYYAVFGLLACAGLDTAPANALYERLLHPRVAALGVEYRDDSAVSAPGPGSSAPR